MTRPRRLKIHHILNASRSNGPGQRAVVWTQGCTLGCPGCFNPETHDFISGEGKPVEDIARDLINLAYGIEGITISGGEPFQQAHALADLLDIIRRSSSLSIIVFTGYTLDELRGIPGAPAALSSIDVLIAGRFEVKNRLAAGLVGSANKTLHFLTPRYSAVDLGSIPEAEVFIQPDGDVVLTGIRPLTWQPEKRQAG